MTSPNVDAAYNITVMIVVLLLIYVIQKVEDDRWSKTDARWLQWMRRVAFITAAILLLSSVGSTDWALTSLLLVSAAGVILAINALALHLRIPPHGGRLVHHAPSGFSTLAARVVSYFRSHA